MDDPLVLLPGMNCSAELWAQVDGLAGALHPRLTEATLDAQVERLLDELPARFALAGLSLGGIVAMALIHRAPERVLRLALLSTNPRGPTPAQRATWRADRERLAAGETARDLQASWLPALLSPSARAEAGIVESVLGMADDVGADALEAQLRLQASRVDQRPGLGSVSCPTMIIAGDADRLCGVDRHRELHRLIPDSELAVLPGVGHLAPLEAPSQTARALRCWSRGTANVGA